MREPLRVSNISFSNSAPFRALAELPGLDYQENPPLENARKLASGSVDIACIPIAEYLAMEGVRCLPFGIGARGPVESVLIFSQVEAPEIRSIVLDGSSRSSAMLTRLLFADRDINFQTGMADEALKKVSGTTAALIIGDRAMRERGRFPVELDLAKLWHERTGYPMVFAVWAVRADHYSEPLMRELCTALARGIAERESYSRRWAALHGASPESIVRYNNLCIDHALSEEHFKGAREFARLATEANLLPHAGWGDKLIAIGYEHARPLVPESFLAPSSGKAQGPLRELVPTRL